MTRRKDGVRGVIGLPRYTRPVADRFWEKVDKSGECWNWTASLDQGGYGKIVVDGRLERSSRLSWILANGAIPEALCVCHHCDNRLCVRPEHLFLGTKRDNAHDMMAKGRRPVGERSTSSKLTEEDVRQIRILRALGVTYTFLESTFPVDRATACEIAKRGIWKHVA